MWHGNRDALRHRLQDNSKLDLRPNRSTSFAWVGHQWPSNRIVSARSIREAVLLNKAPIKLLGARISGDLDLHGVDFTHDLSIVECYFEDCIDVSGFSGKSLNLDRTSIERFEGSDLKLRGDLSFECTLSRGSVALAGAEVRGCIIFSGAHLLSIEHSLVLANAEIRRHLYLNQARLAGKLDAQEIRVDGQFHLNSTKVNFESKATETRNVLRSTEAELINDENVALAVNGGNVRGGIFLTDRFEAHGEVSIVAATIGGQFDASRATLRGRGSRALSIDRSVVDGGVYFVDTTCDGATTLAGTRVAGQVVVSGANFSGSSTHSLSLDNSTIEGDLLVRDGAQFQGTVSLASCQVKGITELTECTIKSEGQSGILALFARFEQGFALQNRVKVFGSISLLRATIGGQLTLDNVLVQPSKTQDAITADGSIVEGSLHIRKLTSHGSVRFIGARVANQVNITYSRMFCGHNRACIFLDAMQCEGDVNLWFLYVRGAVSVAGLATRGNVHLKQVTIENTEKDALIADGLSADNLRLEFVRARGRVRAPSALIRNQVAVAGGHFYNPSSSAFALTYAAVHGPVVFRPDSIVGTLDLRDASVGSWNDSARTWPNKLMLEGFTYQSLEAAPRVTYDERIEWLDRNRPGFTPKTFEQFAKSLATSGRSSEAQAIRIAMQHRIRTDIAGPYFNVLRKIGSHALNAAIGYGYRPFRILLPASALFIAGILYFSSQAARELMVQVPTRNDALVFQPVRYTLDLLIPGALLGDRSRFVPTGLASALSTAFTLGGWALAALLVAGLTGLLKKE